MSRPATPGPRENQARSLPRILVVDDEEAILETMTFTFQDDYEVLTSSDARRALDLLDEKAPVAVVLSDQRMPNMSGVEFVTEVWKRHPSTVRMILSTLKDRDIAARSKGNYDGIPEDEIRTMLQGMIKQRRESITLYEQGGRAELAKQEAEEIAVIEGFLPKQMTDAEAAAAIRALIEELGATSIKDMGRTMTALRERFAGRIDFTKASAAVKQALAK